MFGCFNACLSVWVDGVDLILLADCGCWCFDFLLGFNVDVDLFDCDVCSSIEGIKVNSSWSFYGLSLLKCSIRN